MEDFIIKYGAVLATVIIQSICFIVYIVKSNTRHEANNTMINTRVDDHIKQYETAMAELKVNISKESQSTSLKLDRINEKLDKMTEGNNELRFEFGKLIGYLERQKEKEC